VRDDDGDGIAGDRTVEVMVSSRSDSSTVVASAALASAAGVNSAHISGVNGGRWSHVEHQRFLQAMELFPGKAWKQVSEYVRTRSQTQCRTHAQKWEQKQKQGKELATVDLQCGHHEQYETIVYTERGTKRRREGGREIEAGVGAGTIDESTTQ
jgi:SHAQKYF class myb-like DNA-binding protein